MQTRGYTRPRFAGEDLSDDVATLRDLGADDITVEATVQSSQARTDLISSMSEGDLLVVTSLERVSARTDEVVRTLAQLRERGAAIRCLDRPGLDLGGAAVGELLDALVEHRTRTRSTATREGMKTANKPGRPPSLDEHGVAVARELRRHDRSIAHIANVLGVSASAVQRALAPPRT